MRRSSFHEIGSKTVRRCTASQLMFTRYKLLYIERRGLGLFWLGRRRPRPYLADESV